MFRLRKGRQDDKNRKNDADEKKTHEDLSQITFDDHDGHEMDIEYDEHIWTFLIINTIRFFKTFIAEFEFMN